VYVPLRIRGLQPLRVQRSSTLYRLCFTATTSALTHVPSHVAPQVIRCDYTRARADRSAISVYARISVQRERYIARCIGTWRRSRVTPPRLNFRLWPPHVTSQSCLRRTGAGQQPAAENSAPQHPTWTTATTNRTTNSTGLHAKQPRFHRGPVTALTARPATQERMVAGWGLAGAPCTWT